MATPPNLGMLDSDVTHVLGHADCGTEGELKHVGPSSLSAAFSTSPGANLLTPLVEDVIPALSVQGWGGVGPLISIQFVIGLYPRDKYALSGQNLLNVSKGHRSQGNTLYRILKPTNQVTTGLVRTCKPTELMGHFILQYSRGNPG